MAQWQRQQASRELEAKNFESMSNEQIASYIAAEKARIISQAYSVAKERDEAVAKLQTAQNNERALGTQESARKLAEEHGVSTDQIPHLMSAPDVESMTALDKRVGAVKFTIKRT